jgi:hypothetical protein
LRATSYHFEFGPTPAYGSSTPSQDAGAGNSAATVSATVSDLAPGTTYHYRLVASNGDGTSVGADRTFSTPETTDRTAPVFLAASLKPAAFAIDRRGMPERTVSSAVRKGTTFRYRLSELARVVFTIERVLPGRRVKGRCVKPTRSNARKPKCNRFLLVGRFAMQAATGTNTKRFSGRIGRKTLRVGRYRATLIAKDPSGNVSKPRRLNFRVVRGH